MNKIIFGLSILGLCTALTFTACKKKEEPKEEPVATADENGQGVSDSREAQGENDAAINDVNDVISNDAKFSGKGAGVAGAQGVTGTICGLTVDSLLSNTGIMKLNYNGTTCNNRTRTGTIRLTLLNYAGGSRWKQAGATIKVEYLNYKVTRASDQKSIELNGTQMMTNVSGGTWWHLIILQTQPSLISTVTGTNLAVTWNGTSTATYNINRKFTYSIPSNILTCKCEGIGSTNGLNNLENYGTTRDGDAFTSQVTTPLLWNLTCGPGAPLQGGLDMKISSKNFSLLCNYGMDVNGNPVTVGANACPFGWRLTWTLNNATQSKVIGYF